jgi:hypothetical protein
MLLCASSLSSPQSCLVETCLGCTLLTLQYPQLSTHLNPVLLMLLAVGCRCGTSVKASACRPSKGMSQTSTASCSSLMASLLVLALMTAAAGCLTCAAMERSTTLAMTRYCVASHLWPSADLADWYVPFPNHTNTRSADCSFARALPTAPCFLSSTCCNACASGASVLTRCFVLMLSAWFSLCITAVCWLR